MVFTVPCSEIMTILFSTDQKNALFQRGQATVFTLLSTLESKGLWDKYGKSGHILGEMGRSTVSASRSATLFSLVSKETFWSVVPPLGLLL